jgi:hypothetical protein
MGRCAWTDFHRVVPFFLYIFFYLSSLLMSDWLGLKKEKWQKAGKDCTMKSFIKYY